MRAKILARSRLKNKHFNNLELLDLRPPSLLFKSSDHRVREFLRSSFAADVASRMFCLAVDLFEGILDALRRLMFAEVIEHQSAAHHQGSGIGESFAGDVRRSTMNRLKHGAFVSDVGTGHDAQTNPAARSETISP